LANYKYNPFYDGDWREREREFETSTLRANSLQPLLHSEREREAQLCVDEALALVSVLPENSLSYFQ